jgi:hypothetical protein
MKEFYTLFVAALATWQIVEIWRHSEIMARPRAWFENKECSERDFVRFWGRLAACAFCLSIWVAQVCVPLTHDWHPPVRWLEIVLLVLNLIVTGLAVSRLANLGNDLTYRWCRTTKHDKLVLDIPKALIESDDDDARDESEDVRREGIGDAAGTVQGGSDGDSGTA